MLDDAGAPIPKIVPKLSRGALGRFREEKGIALKHDIFIGPVIVTGTVKSDDADSATGELVKGVLEKHTELTENDLEIRVTPEMGQKRITIYRKDGTFAAKVTGHEIGHWVGYMPEGEMARGNILGRLATLKGYLKSTLDSMIGDATEGMPKELLAELRKQARRAAGKDANKEEVDERFAELAAARGYITKAQVVSELKGLTNWWNPFDPEADDAYTKYRYGSKELYADALSVLLNSPVDLRTRAPLFYATWFQLLERKSEVKTVYEQVVRDVVSGASGDSMLKAIYAGQERGEEAHRELAETTKFEPGSTFGTAFIDRFWDLHRLVAKAKKSGRKIVDPLHAIDTAKYTGSAIEEYKSRNDAVAKFLESSGLTEQDFGSYLTLMRGIHAEKEGGQRAIPVVGDLAGAQKTFDALKAAMGEEKMAALEEARKMFRKIREELPLGRVAETRPYGQDFTDYLMRNEYYSRNEVVDYIDRRHGKGTGLAMFARLGSLKEISNPWSATMAADMSLMWATNWNHAKQQTAQFLLEAGEATEADTKWNGKYHAPVEPKQADRALLTYMENGALRGVYVDKATANAFAKPSDEVRAVSSFLRLLAHPARLWFTTLRPGFQLFNTFFRDPLRTIMNLRGLGTRPWAIYRNLFNSLKAAGVDVTGTPDAVLQEMRKRGLLISWGQYSEADDDTTRLERFLGRQAETTGAWEKYVAGPMRSWYSKMLTLGTIGETANKRAAFVFLKENQARFGLTDEQIDESVRHKAGSPSFITGGTLTPVTNNILLFSNAAIQGWRSDLAAFRDDPLRVGMKRLAYGIMPKVAVIGLATGAVEALFRSLGGDDDDPAVQWAADMQRVLARASKYDLANYTVIPLGLTPTGKAVYLRLPQDETSRVIGGAITKLLTGDNVVDALQDATRYMGDQGPGWNPVATLALEAVQYLSGGNPYDSFRERPAVPERIREAGGAESHKAFGKWLWNRYGGSFIYRFDSDNPTEVKTWGEKFLQLPFISDTAGRFLRISDYGLYQKAIDAREKARAERTRQSLQLESAVKKEAAGEELTEGQTELLAAQPKAAERRRESLQARGGDPLDRALAGASSAEEKKAVIQQVREVEGDSPALARAIREFVGPQLYALSRSRPTSKGKSKAEHSADLAQWESDTKRAHALLEGLPTEDHLAAFKFYWRETRGYKYGPEYWGRRARIIKAIRESE
ncbi:MAG TPA: hypothetical protein VFH61_17440 [Thermoleophilia bacterium]|nr:hypothetical protein [Thermoleophilia bacterium]